MTWTLSDLLNTALPIEDVSPLCQKPPSPRNAIALDQLQRGEDRPLGAAGAKGWRAGMHIVLGALQRGGEPHRALVRRRRIRDGIRPILAHERLDAVAHHAAG